MASSPTWVVAHKQGHFPSSIVFAKAYNLSILLHFLLKLEFNFCLKTKQLFFTLATDFLMFASFPTHFSHLFVAIPLAFS